MRSTSPRQLTALTVRASNPYEEDTNGARIPSRRRRWLRLRRVLLSPEGSRRRLLAHGEVKDIRTGRIILVRGAANEEFVINLLSETGFTSAVDSLRLKYANACWSPK
jgi:hypothetical protein